MFNQIHTYIYIYISIFTLYVHLKHKFLIS